MRRVLAWAGLALPVIIALVLWEFTSRLGLVNPRLFPAPTQVYVAFQQWGMSGVFWSDITSSYVRMLGGLASGGLLGVAFGLATGRVRWAEMTFNPILQAIRPLPPVAIIPLVIVWLGIGNTAKVFAIGFAVFFPVWISTHLGAMAVPREYLWSARVLTVSRIRTVLYVLFPAILPSMVVGLRTAIAVAFVMVYVSELAGASAGLGYRIAVAHLAYRIDLMVAALIALAIAGAVADNVFSRLILKLFPWLRFIQRR